jgi:glycosyltransferase involved in cell wall biosynthesis
MVGGAERVLLNVMAAVRQARPAARLSLIACTDGPLLERAERLGVRVSLLPMPAALAAAGDSQLKGGGPAGRWWQLLRDFGATAPAAWRYCGRLQQCIRQIGPDVIHSNGIKTHLLGHYARGNEVPVVWHLHDFYGSRPLVRRLLRWTNLRPAHAIAVSEAVARDLRELLPRLPIQVIYNTLDVEEFTPAPVPGRRLDELAGLPPARPETLRVGLVATYARWKGHAVFLDAAARLLGTLPRPALRFYIIGGPLYRTRGSQCTEAELRALAARQRIQEHVGFIGFQPDPADVYRALDLVVHASTQPEPFGLTIIEAMACARPVIVAQAGGAAELFHHGHDALGVPPGDVAALAAAVQTLAEDLELRRRLGENGRQTVMQRFNRSRLGEQVLEVYDRCFPGSASAGLRFTRRLAFRET